MTELELIIGYKFSNPELLRQALTHPSAPHEPGKAPLNNQRLEFLGDAVVQLVSSDNLYKLMPDVDEGGLTKARAALVSYKSMAVIARGLGLGRFLIMGRSEVSSGGRDRDAALADLVEAILGAIYLDGGIEPAREAITRLFGQAMQQSRSHAVQEPNPKGRLQEIIQDYSNVRPRYQMVGESGPDHLKTYTVHVSWNEQLLGEGTGTSKKDAEISAAAAAVKNPRLLQLIKALPTKPR
jgi:ribonuclease-3